MSSATQSNEDKKKLNYLKLNILPNQEQVQ